LNERQSKDSSEPRLGQTILSDIRRGDFKRTVRRDYRELKEFFLDERRRDQLKSMGWFKRWFFMLIWLLKSLFLKLTPARRILFLISTILLFNYANTSHNDVNVTVNGNALLGYLLLLFILMLELKDKLLAHDELEEGRSVQIALTPDRQPVVEGWDIWLFTRPANEVGGDMVDYLKISDEKVGLALGDVAGKGLKAALLMAKLQSTLRALISDIDSLSELGGKINKIFHRDSLPNLFASLVYLKVVPNSGKLEILNAGHMPPLIMSDGRITEMPKGGPALGLMEKAEFNSQAAELKEGDILIVYSDGVTEARDEFGDFFGERKLRDLLPRLTALSSASIGERILAYVENFVGEARYYDDLSLIVMKKTGN
jgi:hypothetical protein